MTRKTKTTVEASAHLLHDRATRGETLTVAEQAALHAWYAQQDTAESAVLTASAVPELSTLQAQVDAALARLQIETQRIQVLTAENDALRREIASLVQQLRQSPTRTL